jgi:hypothetical protein
MTLNWAIVATQKSVVSRCLVLLGFVVGGVLWKEL